MNNSNEKKPVIQSKRTSWKEEIETSALQLKAIKQTIAESELLLKMMQKKLEISREQVQNERSFIPVMVVAEWKNAFERVKESNDIFAMELEKIVQKWEVASQSMAHLANEIETASQIANFNLPPNFSSDLTLIQHLIHLITDMQTIQNSFAPLHGQIQQANNDFAITTTAILEKAASSQKYQVKQIDLQNNTAANPLYVRCFIFLERFRQITRPITQSIDPLVGQMTWKIAIRWPLWIKKNLIKIFYKADNYLLLEVLKAGNIALALEILNDKNDTMEVVDGETNRTALIILLANADNWAEIKSYHAALLKLLKLQLIDINHQDHSGNTALHYAVQHVFNGTRMMPKIYASFVEILLQHGANPCLKNKNGHDPLAASPIFLNNTSGNLEFKCFEDELYLTCSTMLETIKMLSQVMQFHQNDTTKIVILKLVNKIKIYLKNTPFLRQNAYKINLKDQTLELKALSTHEYNNLPYKDNIILGFDQFQNEKSDIPAMLTMISEISATLNQPSFLDSTTIDSINVFEQKQIKVSAHKVKQI